MAVADDLARGELGEAPALSALIAARSDRVVWGTDWPHPGGRRHEGDAAFQIEPFIKVDDGAALRRLRDWAGDVLRFRRILVDNPARLYGF